MPALPKVPLLLQPHPQPFPHELHPSQLQLLHPQPQLLQPERLLL
jgi:hypothetical protein